MHFVDAWTSLSPLELVWRVAPAAIAVVAMLLPGRLVARTASLALALAAPLSPDLGTPLIRAAWFVMWLGVALVSGAKRDPAERTEAARPGGIESGAVGLLLGVALLVVMVVALGREDLPAEPTRRISLGVLLITAGIVHLTLRRDALRGAMAFATIGLGLQWLDRAARGVVIESAAEPAGVVLFASAIAVVLSARVALVRQQDAGSAWVSHAHDLHD
jgi:hypothetical protein